MDIYKKKTCLTWICRTNINLDLSIGMKYINMIMVSILALRFLIKLRFPTNTPVVLFSGLDLVQALL